MREGTNHKPQGTVPAPSSVVRWSKIGLVIALIAIVAILFVHHFRRVFGNVGTSAPPLEEISTLLSIQFPPSARLIHSYYTAWQDWALYAKVEIDRADVDRFIAALPSPEKLSRTDRLLVTNVLFDWSKHSSWWDPDSARDFIAVEIHRGPLPNSGEFALVYLLINLDDPNQAVIYLHSFG
ncbi:MAG: hypothetical protein KAW89_04030 [Armatimonadetes bacterium]|nr:hypothetical protein [Armatimonadota bacterium]